MELAPGTWYNMTTTFRPVSYLDILDSPEAADLLKEYGEECSIPEIGSICPQRDLYARMESTGLMGSFGMYLDDVLIGFVTLLFFVLPHYGKKVANVESLFLARAHRRGRLGYELLVKAESVAREAGCSVVLYNARAGSKFERLLTTSSRYERTNSVFLRDLSHE
jgi:GNAT superfamily N-acetyltransferase